MLPKDPYSAFEDELRKLERADRRKQPVKAWVRDSGPLLIWYLVFCAFHVVTCLIPWAIGIWFCLRWLLGGA